MLRITESKNAEAAKQYFGKGLVRSDYYTDGQEIPGLWGGKAAERLGLSGQVDQERYFALCDNLHPQTKDQLTPRQRENRRTTYDFTFSTPKSVSVLWELSGDERILTAFRDAVKDTMEEAEREMKTRVRKGGVNENRVTGNMVWAEFVHFTSRPVDGRPDPHLHAHVVVPNMTWDDTEQRWKAGQFGDMKRDAPYFEAAFDARLANKLSALGYATKKSGLSFEMAGIPKSIIDKFSRRRDAIEAKADLQAVDDGKQALIIAPTHAEGGRLSDELRQALRDRGLLGHERAFTVRRVTGWTEAQKNDARNYEPGMVVEFNQAVAGVRQSLAGTRATSGGFAKGESAGVKGMENGRVKLVRQDGRDAYLPEQNSERFQVYRTRELSIAKGDRIRITKNGETQGEGYAKGARINNGDIFTVEGFTNEGDIRIGNGKLLSRNHGHFTLGYVDTSYASQGKTVDRVFIATGNESLPAANRQQWYVSVSRGRDAAKIYTESKDNLRDAIARGGERLSAVELTRTKLRQSWRTQFMKSVERSRVARFLKSRAEATGEYRRDRGRARGGLSHA